MNGGRVDIPIELQGVLASSEDTLGGAMRFIGTRVPVQALIDTIATGKGLEDFMDGFPGVTREQAETVLTWEQNQAREMLGLDKAS